MTGGQERIRYYLENCHLQCGFNGDLTPNIDKPHADKTRHCVQLLRENTLQLRVGVQRLINECREAGLHFALATTSIPKIIRGLLRNTFGKQAIDWFDCIAHGGSVGSPKNGSRYVSFLFTITWLSRKGLSGYCRFH